MRKSLMLAVAMGLMHAPAAAENAETAQADDDSQKTICKRMDPPAGSRISGKRVCKTKAEWDAEKHGQREAMREIERNGSLTSN